MYTRTHTHAHNTYNTHTRTYGTCAEQKKNNSRLRLTRASTHTRALVRAHVHYNIYNTRRRLGSRELYRVARGGIIIRSPLHSHGNDYHGGGDDGTGQPPPVRSVRKRFPRCRRRRPEAAAGARTRDSNRVFFSLSCCRCRCCYSASPTVADNLGRRRPAGYKLFSSFCFVPPSVFVPLHRYVRIIYYRQVPCACVCTGTIIIVSRARRRIAPRRAHVPALLTPFPPPPSPSPSSQ